MVRQNIISPKQDSTGENHELDHTAITYGHCSQLISQCSVPMSDCISLVNNRMRDLLLTGDEPFSPIYHHMLTTCGKRVRAGMTIACANLNHSCISVPPLDLIDLACSVEMFHESSLIHDDICDSSLSRRGNLSVAAAFGIRAAARAGFYLAGVALELAARVENDNLVSFKESTQVPGITCHSQLSELSFGQLVETLPQSNDVKSLRRHYQTIAIAKTGTLFRLACSYGGILGHIDQERLRHLMSYANHLALAFQIMDDIRDIVGGAGLGKKACGDLDRRILTWPVIEWITIIPGAIEIWSSVKTSTDELQTHLVNSGAIETSYAAAIRAVKDAETALKNFKSTPALEHLQSLLSKIVVL